MVPTLLDKLKLDSVWCGTFQLIWNDMKNDLVGEDIVFNPQLEIVNNLNKETFTDKMLSDSYYYKVYGLKNLELKKEIEKAIKTKFNSYGNSEVPEIKFNETSDILDSFDWSNEALDNQDPLVRRYFFYTMLSREFKFLKAFTKLNNASFNKYTNIKYFGIDNNTKEDVNNNMEVLFYNNNVDFAILINTKSNDEVIFYKNPQGDNFQNIYNNMLIQTKNYNGTKYFSKYDTFKAPYISLNIKKEYSELANKKYKTKEGEGEIYKALQTIKFTLDEKGGKIKSEAAIDANTSLSAQTGREFSVNNTFALFLREKGQEKPYFAALINDITKFQ